MNDADRQLLIEVRDLLRQVVGQPKPDEVRAEVVMMCAAQDVQAAIRERNRRKSHKGGTR